MKYSLDEWIQAFKEAFDRITAIPRDEWELIDVYALSRDMMAVVVNHGLEQFAIRFSSESLNIGFGLHPPAELATDLILGEILEPQSTDSRSSSLTLEGRYPQAMWSGEYPEGDDQAVSG